MLVNKSALIYEHDYFFIFLLSYEETGSWHCDAVSWNVSMFLICRSKNTTQTDGRAPTRDFCKTQCVTQRSAHHVTSITSWLVRQDAAGKREGRRVGWHQRAVPLLTVPSWFLKVCLGSQWGHGSRMHHSEGGGGVGGGGVCYNKAGDCALTTADKRGTEDIHRNPTREKKFF